MLNPRRMFLPMLVLSFVLTACGGDSSPTSDVNAIMTAGIGTMVASYFGTQTALYSPPPPTATVTETLYPTPTDLPRAATRTSTPTWPYFSPIPGTATVTGTLPTVTVNAGALGYGCYNLAFVRDVTYPDGTSAAAGQDFTKTWKVANSGSCNWLFLYHLMYTGGTNMDPIYVKLGKVIMPGNWTELSVALNAPTKPGTYTSYFRFSDGTHMFGATLGVTIVVPAPATDTLPPPPATSTPTATFTDTPTSTPTP